jgi:membrane-bound inhibitor of C-type lysozyme
MKNGNKIFLLAVAAIILIVLAAVLDAAFRRQTKSVTPEKLSKSAAAPARSVEKRPAAQSAKQDKTVLFKCAGGKTIQATFHLPADQDVSLVLSDGRKLDVLHAVSADGARYANADESFVFWNVGDTAFVQEKGKTTFDNCVLGAASSRSE